MSVIDDPAVARAIDRCVTARAIADRRGPVTRTHPRPCGWCDYPTDHLVRLLEGFNVWSGWDERTRTYERHDVRVWTVAARRNPAEAERLIVAAQGLVEPLPATPPPPAHESGAPQPAPPVDEELAAWT